MKCNGTIGDSVLSAWLVAPGVCWIQTRSPEFARNLARREDTREVAIGVAGGYLRTFEAKRNLGWARRLIARYQESGRSTNAQVLAQECPTSSRSNPDGIKRQAALLGSQKRVLRATACSN